jgi:hypothetical protein
MKMDMANFTLTQNRQLISSQSSRIEFEEFMKIYEMDKCKKLFLKISLKKLF